MIAVIDYGLGNLRSVHKALEVVGADVKITNRSKDLSEARAIILPGVGAFQRGMRNLNELNILPAIYNVIEQGKPFLGICLGLQLLFTESEEHGRHKGLDVIKGRVKKFSIDVKIPHMGWNQIKQSAIGNRQSAEKIFERIPKNSYFYFVHSYYVEPENDNVIAATADYGKEFVCAIVQNNVWGVQFHPEKSDVLGLKILENFWRSSLV